MLVGGVCGWGRNSLQGVRDFWDTQPEEFRKLSHLALAVLLSPLRTLLDGVERCFSAMRRTHRDRLTMGKAQPDGPSHIAEMRMTKHAELWLHAPQQGQAGGGAAGTPAASTAGGAGSLRRPCEANTAKPVELCSVRAAAVAAFHERASVHALLQQHFPWFDWSKDDWH
ncbi:hypothetical protein PLESTM_000992700 [Pleodorina starrii]|nr:hypothetical protein PLESTM_000992700 [Pleodorina starrii]